MSEKPISLIDDKTSSQVTYNTDQIMDDHEARRAFFEHAERQIAQPPKFERIDLYEEPKAFDPEMMTETTNSSFVAEAPVYAKEPITHRETLERAYHYMDTPELVADARVCTKSVVMIRKYGIATKGA